MRGYPVFRVPTPNIVGIRVVDSKTHSSPWLILLGTTYVNVVSVLTEDDRYIILHHHLFLKWRPCI
jgi:hypothetical protein